MGSKRFACAAAVIDGKLYAIGGHNSTGYLDSVERYDPSTNTWEAVAAMGTKRGGSTAVALAGKLYAMGGKAFSGASSYLDSVERYDPASNAWEAVAVIGKKRGFLACASL